MALTRPRMDPAVRDALAWRRMSTGRRLLVSALNPERADRMAAAARQLAMAEAAMMTARANDDGGFNAFRASTYLKPRRR